MCTTLENLSEGELICCVENLVEENEALQDSLTLAGHAGLLACTAGQMAVEELRQMTIAYDHLNDMYRPPRVSAVIHCLMRRCRLFGFDGVPSDLCSWIETQLLKSSATVAKECIKDDTVLDEIIAVCNGFDITCPEEDLPNAIHESLQDLKDCEEWDEQFDELIERLGFDNDGVESRLEWVEACVQTGPTLLIQLMESSDAGKALADPFAPVRLINKSSAYAFGFQAGRWNKSCKILIDLLLDYHSGGSRGVFAANVKDILTKVGKV